MQLQSVEETARRFHISERRVQKLCETGRINGAQMISNVWLIPDTAEKPSDERFSIEMENMLSLSDLCNELSISLATGRNWIKLGKLTPSTVVKKTPYFTKDYITKIKSDIMTGENASLKSRRNKKFISGSNIYNSYVSDDSKNIATVQNLLDIIGRNEISIDDNIIIALLAECAIQLIVSKTENTSIVNGLNLFMEGKLNDNPYMFLIDDLVRLNSSLITTTENYPKLFGNHYEYEDAEDILGLLYISLKNIGNRKATGSYYTPTAVVKKLCSNLLAINDSIGKTVIDPCCGTGNFILQLPSLFDCINVYGNDIDCISVRLARINYALKYLISNKEQIYAHITENDYLSFSHEIKYDFIIGNPPWGYDYSDAEKDSLRKRFMCATRSSIESYDVFVEQAFSNLNKNGVLSFVLPEAFLNVKAHTSIRQLLLETNSIQYLEFLDNAFDKVQCPCIILQIIHTEHPFSSIGLKVNEGSRSFTILKNRVISAECFSFAMSDEEYSVLDKIENVREKTTLSGNAIFALGIVTGNNKEYISNIKDATNEMILKGSDVYKYRFNNSDNYIVFKPEAFQQIAPTEYYRAEEKLLYRFICNQLIFAYDNKQTLSLNSCNILIPQIPALNIRYIMAILNSRIAQFYFKKQFNSVKVLRSHIEQIPIPVIGKKTQEKIIGLVDSLLCTSSVADTIELYEALDMIIADIFKLTEYEYHLIKASMEEQNLFLPN